MTKFHAVVHLDHQHAQILQFDAHEVHADRIDAHFRYSRQHGADARATQAYFAEVCAALDGVPEVLVVGAHVVTAEFRHHVEQHHAKLLPHLVGFEPVDHPSPGQLLAHARQFFVKHDRMAGVPTPT
jgi:hypothetical protein